MSKLRVNSFTSRSTVTAPARARACRSRSASAERRCISWMIGTRTFRKLFGSEGGTTGVDDEFAQRGFANVGAWILGRNMFGPVRGAWPDESWRGWWGDDPPYHCDVVRADAPRAQVVRDGGRHDVPFRDGRHRGSARACAQGCRRQGRARRRRRRDDPAVPARASHRRAAHRVRARAARLRRSAVRRHRSAGARLRGHGARRDGRRDARRAD